MSELDSLLGTLGAHEGVEQLVLLGRDGLVVQHLNGRHADVETVAARVPALAAACEALGRAGSMEEFRTAVLEFESGVAIVVTLSADLLLTAILRSGVGFAPLLRDLRANREILIRLL